MADSATRTGSAKDGAERSEAQGKLVGLLIVGALAAYWLAPKFFVYGSPDYKLEAADLKTEFMFNEVTAFAKYDGTLVELSGQLRNVRMRGSSPIVAVGPPLFNVDCELPSSEAGRAGQMTGMATITVRGRLHASGSSLRLSPCKLM